MLLFQTVCVLLLIFFDFPVRLHILGKFDEDLTRTLGPRIFLSKEVFK